MSMMDLYNHNADFRGYVDRYCKNYVEGVSIPKEEAFKHELIKMMAEKYLEEEESKNE